MDARGSSVVLLTIFRALGYVAAKDLAAATQLASMSKSGQLVMMMFEVEVSANTMSTNT